LFGLIFVLFIFILTVAMIVSIIRLNANYTSKEAALDNEEPVPDLASLTPHDGHIMRRDGTSHTVEVTDPFGQCHPFHHRLPQVGLWLSEQCRRNMKDAISLDPLRAVSEVYEEEFARVREGLDGVDREEFIGIFPTYLALERTLYRYVSKLACLHFDLSYSVCLHFVFPNWSVSRQRWEKHVKMSQVAEPQINCDHCS
jgi:hypothetical protein